MGSWRVLVGFVVCWLVGLMCVSSVALAGEASLGSPSLLGDPLVVSGVESLVGGQDEAAEAVMRTSPQLIAERESSAGSYVGMSGGAAEALVSRVFPGLVDVPDGGLSSLPEGSKIVGYPTDSAASLVLSDGRRGVLESSSPIAVEGSGGQRVPVDLGLSRVGGGFRPRTPFLGAGVDLPGRLSDGFSLSDVGVSLTPVADERGASLAAAEGVLDGSSVFYANSEDEQAGVFDLDTIVKPSTFGFSTVSLLRSRRSPERLFFAIGLPRGASLAQLGGDGPVRVMREGEVIAVVLPPVARDARGVPVPVRMTVSGSILTVIVAHRAAPHFYPIMVDPTVQEKHFRVNNYGSGNWAFLTDDSGSLGGGESCNEHETECSVSMFSKVVWNGSKYVNAEYTAGQYARLVYQTQKESRIYELSGSAYVTEEQAQEKGRVEGRVAIQSSGGVTEKGAEVGLPSTEWNSEKGSRSYEKNVGLCLEAGCGTGSVATSHENNVLFEVHVDESGNKLFEDELKRGVSIGILQETGPSVATDTTDATLGGLPNGFYGGKWVNASWANVGVAASDPGIGLSAFSIGSPQASGWGHGFDALGGCQGVQCNECWNWSSKCTSGQSTSNEPIIAGLAGLPDGKDTVEVKAENATTESGGASGAVYIDNTPPYGLRLTGLPSGNEVGKGTYKVKAEATDGTSVESSGVASISVTLDGKAVSIPSAKCAPGPCTASSEWSLVGTELAAGRHQLVITATDGAGNVAIEKIALMAHPAASVQVGPGSVNPYTGEFRLAATDVSMGDGLTVTRSFGSRHLTAGTEGPFGAQWGLGLGGQESLVKQANGSMILNAANGEQTIFSTNEGGFSSPPGDVNLSLSSTPCEAGKTEYMLRNAAADTTTCFRAPQGGSGEVLVPSIVKGAVATETVTYSYETVEVPSSSGKKIIRPTEALAPVPIGVSCSPELKNGCRALTFNYASSTTATGEKSGEWGDYQGNITRVYFNGWDPVSKEMKKEVAVAQYAYDRQGRLRAEWDPRVSSALKTTYGYDPENRVTAIDPPGQQPWILTYGTTKEDVGAGRLLKVYRPPAATGLWSGEITKNTEAPRLSGTPGVGARMSVSNGSWSASPLAYGYQWSDCNSSGAECKPIGGADNPNYTPASSDVGHTLVVQMTAINGGGSTAVSTAASALVTANGRYPNYSQTIDSNSLNAVSCVAGTTDCVVGDSAGKALYATNVSVSSSATWNGWSGPGTSPSEAVSCPTSSLCLMASGSDNGYGGNMYYATSLGGSWPLAFSPTDGVDAISCVSSTFCVAAQNASGYFRYSTKPSSTSWPTEQQGTASIKGVDCLSSSFCAMVDSVGKVHVATTTTQIESSTWKESDVDGTTAMTGIGCISTSLCLAIDGTGAVITLTIESNGFATGSSYTVDENGAFSAITCTGSTCVAADNKGNVFVYTQASEHWIKELSLEDKPVSVSCSSASLCVTTDSAGKLTAFNTVAVQDGEARPPQPGSTIEYNVPLQNPGLPNLNAGEVEQWGQKDDPVEGIAIFPPDEQQGWPATDYKRATVTYLDREGHPVNVVTPGGGVSTTEYNETNDVVRTLTPDNREMARKEGAKSIEASKTLDTQSTYNSEGTELLSTLGPQHNVKLPIGTEVQARSHTAYSYDEGAPSEGGPYRLVTKTTQGAQVSGKEEDVRTTRTYYSGQNGLGWKLRKPTSVVADPAGLDLTHTTVYNEATGAVVETKMPKGTAETVYPPSYSFSIGSEGSEPGQFNHPESVALDSSGNLWVVDKVNDRIEKFSSTGAFIAAYGSKGSGNLQFSEPWGIAISTTTGNVFVTDQGNNRVQELNSKGEYVRSLGEAGTGNGQFKGPSGVIVDSKGDVWVSDEGDNRVQELSETGEYKSQFGSTGTGEGQLKAPVDIAISEGELYVVDSGNNRVAEFSPTGAYLGQIGTSGKGPGQLSEPKGIAASPTNGDLYVTDFNEGRVQEFSPAGKFLTQWETWSKTHEVANPVGIAINGTGSLYLTDRYAGKLTAWTLPEAGGAQLNYAVTFGTLGTGEGQFDRPYSAAIDGEGDLWVTDHANNRIEKLTTQGKPLASYGSTGSGNLQFKGPWGVAINKGTGNVYVSDGENNRIEELSATGAFLRTFGTTGSGALELPKGVAIDSSGDVWVADFGHNRIVEFSATGEYMTAYGSYGSGEKQFKSPAGILYSAGDVYVSDVGDDRIEELSTSGAYVRSFGHEGDGSGEFYGPFGIATDAAGNIYVVDQGNDRVQEFSPTGSFLASFGSKGSGEGQLNEPTSLAVSSAGDMYVIDTANNRVEHWTPADRAAHDTKTIYYTASTEAETVACQNHPEWATLPCLIEPAAQPETPGLPQLPVTTTTYNMYQEPLTITSTSGTATRTTTNTYEESGRLATTETTSTVGASLPKVTDKYSTTLGVLTEQSTSSESVKSAFNTLGELTSYTDADGNTATYEYEKEKDARLTKVSDGKGSQTLVYDETTGLVKELVDSSAGTFTAGYDMEGNLVGETFPNGMKETYTFDPTGTATGLTYKKETNCTEKCEWFTDSVVPSIHGQWASQTSTFSKEAYTYDTTGRLTETQDTPNGKGCVTRRYSYDEDTNRTSLTTFQPNSKNECSTETGTIEKHVYDEADRLADNGVTYDPFGDTEKLPASDAGGTELTSKFYADNQVVSQEQDGQTIGYNVDPAGRTRETVSTGKIVASEILHYDGPTSTPSWTGEPSGKTTRDINAFGGLAAIQHETETPVLQIANLQGDIVATASESETAKELASTISEPTEYGVPTTETPPKYSWLGYHEVPTMLPSGVTSMGARSYIPQLGRFLQTDPIAGGSANAYAYTNGDPVNETDLTGMYTITLSATLIAAENKNSEEEAARGIALAATESTARAEAQRKAAEAAAQAAAYAAIKQNEWMYGTTGSEESGPEEEYWEEEGEEYENVSDRQGGTQGNGGMRIEPALLVSPLNGEETGEGAAVAGSVVPLCKAGSEGPCSSDAKGRSGEKCGSMYANKSCHHNYTKAQINQFEHERCRTVGVGIAVAGYFLPEARLAKAILAGIGIGTALSC